MKNLNNVLRFGWPYLRRYWGRLLAGVLLGVLFGLSNASFIWASKTTFDRLSPSAQISEPAGTTAPSAIKNRASAIKSRVSAAVKSAIDPWLPLAGRPIDARQIVGGLLLLPILVGIRGFVGYLSSYCMGWVSERVMNDLRLDVLEKLNSLSLDFFNRSTMGDLLMRINGDTAALHNCLNLGFSDLIKEPVTLFGVFVILCFLDWKLTLFASIFLPLCLIPMSVLGKKAGRASRESLNANIQQGSLLVELISSIRIVKAYGLESEQVARFRRFSRQLIHHGMKGVQATELINPLIETTSMIGVGVLIVYIFYQRHSVPDVVGFLVGIVMMYTPIRKLAGLHVRFQQASTGVDRLIHILAEQPSVKELPDAQPIPRFSTAITFESVGFSYGNQMVVNDINLAIPRGFKLGIAGESGSGKSTLVNLIFRFYDPTQGAIKIDGHDLRHVPLGQLRQLMALVSQEVVVFDQTVEDNIACGKPGATRAEVEEAARAAYAHDFVLALPLGYDTRLGERGVTLSGGQRQRIAIARAFIRNAPILVLDEATAALDSQSESEVQAAIDRLTENRTVICIAHRLSTLASTDGIIVLSQGRIIETGKFAELLRAGGPFAAMARKQGIRDRVERV